MKKEQIIIISKNDESMIPNIEIKVSLLASNNLGLEDVSFAFLEDDMGQSSYIMSKCPNGMSIEDI